MKHIQRFEEKINESSIGRGSVVLIKGKPEKGKKRLFATHVIGSTEHGAGSTMLFLSDEFYRIKEEDGQLKPIKISYRNDASLKAALNLKSPGKISIVKNNNKTPLHWKTLKHTSLASALKAVESDLRSEEYLLESQGVAENLLSEFYIEVTKSLLRAFNGEIKDLKILEYSVDSDLVDHLEGLALDLDTTDVSDNWESSFSVFLYSDRFTKYFDALGISLKDVDVSFFFNSEASFIFSGSPGTYWEPPSFDSDLKELSTTLREIFVDGGEVDPTQDPELSALLKDFMTKIKDDTSIHEMMKKIEHLHFFK